MNVVLDTKAGSIVIQIENNKIQKIELISQHLENTFDSETKKYFDIIYSYLFGNLKRIPEIFFNFPGKTNFAKKVYEELYKTKKGNTITYKELALKAGNSKASRAVGVLMKNNPLPIIIPCHRVIKSDGSLGGFSAGIDWKQYLLNIEKRR